MAVVSLKYKSKQGTLTAPGDVDPGAMIPIATTTVGSTSVTNIEFTSIPNVYEHLQLRVFLFGVNATATGSINVQFNSDTGSNYAFHLLQGYGAGVDAYGAASSSNGRFFGYRGGIRTTYATAGVVDILDYSNTNKYKTMRGLVGNDFNGSGEIQLSSSLWQNTNAITSIKIYGSDQNFGQHSTIALYGIKRAGA